MFSLFPLLFPDHSFQVFRLLYGDHEISSKYAYSAAIVLLVVCRFDIKEKPFLGVVAEFLFDRRTVRRVVHAVDCGDSVGLLPQSDPNALSITIM